MKIFIFIEWALFHSQSLCYVINIYIYLNSFQTYARSGVSNYTPDVLSTLAIRPGILYV